MPQLDKVTFLSQFFWLSFFYLAFYFLILKNFLPKMSRILKFRKKKNQKTSTYLINDKHYFDKMVAKSLNKSKKLFTENIDRTFTWLDNIKNNTNKTHYLSINNAYIQSVGETFLADNLPFSHFSSKKSEKIFTQLLLSKIKKNI